MTSIASLNASTILAPAGESAAARDPRTDFRGAFSIDFFRLATFPMGLPVLDFRQFDLLENSKARCFLYASIITFTADNPMERDHPAHSFRKSRPKRWSQIPEKTRNKRDKNHSYPVLILLRRIGAFEALAFP
jgi:hypothetical protein